MELDTNPTDTSTNLGDQSTPFVPEHTSVLPPEVLIAESVSEEVRTSGIPTNISHVDVNANMGDGMSTHEAQGTSTVVTSSIPVSIVLSSTIKTTILDTSISLPPFITPTPTSLPASSTSPIYHNILNQPITSLFPYQSTEGTKSTPYFDQDDNDIMVSFADIQFDSKEDNFPDHMLMSGKQFKILNPKLNSSSTLC